MPRLDLGATRNLSSVQQDLYHLARLAGAFGAFQLSGPMSHIGLGGWRGPQPARVDRLVSLPAHEPGEKRVGHDFYF
jgi:hypothetical protein